MRTLSPRRATITALATTITAVLLGSAFVDATAAADPAPAPPAQADILPPELVRAIADDLHMTAAEYVDRAQRAQQLHDYAREFRSQRPDDYAGAWLAADGKPVMAVTSQTAASVAAAAGYQTRLAPISADHLDGSLDQLMAWIATLPRQLAQAVNGVAIDALNSQLVLSVANTPAGHLLNLPTLIANVKVVLSPDGGGPIDHHPMGGDTYISARTSLDDSSLQSVDICSFGFNSVDAGGNALNISAGHCDPNLGHGDQAGVYVPDLQDLKASPQVGSFVRARLGDGDGLDYSLIRLNDRAVRAGMDQPSVRGSNGTTVTVTGIADPITGAPVCKSGQSSTFTCGFVSADRVETELFDTDGQSKTVRGFANTACTLGGDSGGAIMSGTLALGITSGSNAAQAPDCQVANVDHAIAGGTASLGIPVREILSAIDADSGGGVGAGIEIRTRTGQS